MADSALVGIPSFNLSQIMGMLGQIGLIVVIGLIVIGLIWVIRYFVLFNVEVILFNDPGGRIIKRDNIKLNYKKKQVESLKQKMLFYPYPTTDMIYFRGKKQCLMGRVKNNCVSWMGVGENPLFIPANLNWYDALGTRLQKNAELTANKDFWSKNKDMIVAMAGYAALIIVAILVTQQMGKLIETNQNIAATNAGMVSQKLMMLASLSMVKGWKKTGEERSSQSRSSA